VNRWHFILFATLLALAIPTVSGHTQQADKVAELMKKKLIYSQKVLEGIALNDPDIIIKNAQELILISQKAEWLVLQTPEYKLHSNDFRRTAETMVTQAKAKNMDAAALAYVEMTLTCVKCHKHVREVRMARLEGSPSLAKADVQTQGP
jgi:hypothetical protein